MAVQSVSILFFLELAASYPVLDVRSPGEYKHAHIPGAVSFPLFTDEQRKEIGTTYKQQSREQAIKIGLDAFGPGMRGMVEAAERLNPPQNTLLVHCWRGGMRSAAVAWLLDLYGFRVYLLEGGYKAYRHWVISHWEDDSTFRVVSGNTGAGKTEVLKALEELGAPVLDLEAIAGHKGSAFGNLDRVPQPTQEMFENLLAKRLAQLRQQFGRSAIWVEDESQRIGDVNIPFLFFRKISASGKVYLDAPFETRLDNILRQYGKHRQESLINAIVRIKKRLGPLETKTAIGHLLDGEPRLCFAQLLRYYDKQYNLKDHTGLDTYVHTGQNTRELASQLRSKYP